MGFDPIHVQYFIRVEEASREDDLHRNTDLLVLWLSRWSVRVACRVRSRSLNPKWDYLTRYPNDITVRVDRPESGAKTELEKILDGWGDYYFYGFDADYCGGNPDKCKGKLAAWTLGDLAAFRRWWQDALRNTGKPPVDVEKRKLRAPDRKAWLLPLRISELPADFVLARKLPDDKEWRIMRAPS